MEYEDKLNRKMVKKSARLLQRTPSNFIHLRKENISLGLISLKEKEKMKKTDFLMFLFYEPPFSIIRETSLTILREQ